MSTHVGDIFFDAKIDRSQYDKGLGSLEKSATSIASKLSKALTISVAVAGVAGLVNATKKVAELGDNIDKMSQKLGMSQKAYQEWDYIMQRCGASIDSMTTAMKTLASSVETGKDALKALGISQEEALGLSQEQLFERVITALQGVEDTTKRTYLASQLLGRGATELGAVLNLSAQDMAYLRSNLESLGGIMSTTAVANSAQFKDSLTDLHMALRGIGDVLATYILPILTAVINKVVIPAIKFITMLFQTLFGWIAKVVGTLGIFRGAVDKSFGKDTQSAIQDTGISLEGVGGGIGNVGKSANKSKKAVQQLKRELMGFDKIVKLSENTGNNAGTTGGGIGGGGGAGGFDDIGGIADMVDNLSIPEETTSSWDGLGAKVAKVLADILDVGAKALTEVILPLIGAVTKSIVPIALDLVGTALKNIVDFATKLPQWLMNLLTNGDKTVTIDVNDKFTEKWREIAKLNDTNITVNVGLKKNFGANNNTVADWLVNSNLIGQAKAFIGLDRGFSGTVADWLKNNNYIGTVTAPVALKTNFGTNLTTVAKWISQSSIMGSTVNFLIGLGKNFGNGITTVQQWIKSAPVLGGAYNFVVGLAKGFGNSINTVADWIKSTPVLGSAVNFGIGLAKNFGNSIGTVAQWIKSGAQWGDATNKPIGLTKNFGSSIGSVNQWLRANSQWGDETKKPVGLLRNFGTNINSVNQWLRASSQWGDETNKPIGLRKGFGNNINSVNQWLKASSQWGDETNKPIGLTKNFIGADGKKKSTVSAWVKSYIGDQITITANIVSNGASNARRGATGGVYKNGTWKPIQQFAGGGILGTHGQLFIAREAGAELVGTLGGHTAVMNNDQIVASVSSGVAKAIAGIRFKMTAPRLSNVTPLTSTSTQITNDNTELVTLLKTLITVVQGLDLDVTLDGEKIKNNTVKRINQNTISTGKLEFII